MVADFFTKPLQGSVFKKLRAIVMNLPDDVPLPMTTSGPQECVNGPSWAEVVSKKMVRPSSGCDIDESTTTTSRSNGDVAKKTGKVVKRQQ
jgi:hypothetical protein